MTETNVSTTTQPDHDLKSLDRLVGTWKLSGGAQGQIRYEWTEGGFFLMQHIDLDHDGHRIKAIEVIGHRHGLGEAPGEDIGSRVYSFLDGLTLDYVYELVGDTFTIWGGYKGSDARFQATFAADGDSFRGGWVWPGGGYEVTGIRIR